MDTGMMSRQKDDGAGRHMRCPSQGEDRLYTVLNIHALFIMRICSHCGLPSLAGIEHRYRLRCNVKGDFPFRECR